MRKAKFKKSLIVLLGVVFLQPRVCAEEDSSLLSSTPSKQSESFPQQLWNQPKETVSQLAYSAAEGLLYYWPTTLTTVAGAISGAVVGKKTGYGWSGPIGGGLIGAAGGIGASAAADTFTPEPIKKTVTEAVVDAWQAFSQFKAGAVNYVSSLTGSDNPQSPQQILVTDPVLAEKMQKQEVDIEGLKSQIQRIEDSYKKAIDELQRQNEVKSDSTLNFSGGGSGEPPHSWAVSLAEQVEQNTAAIGNLQHQIHHNDKKATRGIAAMAALGNIASPSAPGKTIVGAGIGSYHGTQAVAVNISHRPKSFSNTIFQAGIGTSTGGKPVIRAGVSYEF